MFNRKGQSTLEYALIIAVVVGGLLLMQHYVKRGYAGRLKGAADQMGEQYDPAMYSGNFTVNEVTRSNQTVNKDITTTNYTQYLSNRTGNETIKSWDNQQLFGN